MSTETHTDEGPARYSPLITEANEKGELPTAREIARFRLYRWLPAASAGRPLRKVPVPRWEFMTPEGKPFQINVFETDEDDLAEQFGGGDFYIEPIGYDGRPLPCGHTLPLPGRPKYRTQKDMEDASPPVAGAVEEEPDASSELLHGRGNHGGSDAMLIETIRRLENRVDELSRGNNHGGGIAARDIATIATSRDEVSSEALRSMRDESTRKSDEYNRATAELMRSHADELRRRDRLDEERRAADRKTLDDEREEYVNKRRQVQLHEEESRAAFRRDLDAERRRADKEADDTKASFREALAIERRQMEERIKDYDQRLADERERRVREISDARRDGERHTQDLQRELDEVRKKLTKEIDELRKKCLDFERDNIELRRELADRPEADAPPPPPQGLSTSPDKPWWFDEGKAMLGGIFESFKEAAEKRQQQQLHAPQQAPQQQPAQQVAQNPYPQTETDDSGDTFTEEPEEPSEPTPSAFAASPPEPVEPVTRVVTQPEPQEVSGAWVD